MGSVTAPAWLLTAWVAIAWGISSRDGRYSPLGLALVVLGCVCVVGGLVAAGRRGGRRVVVGGSFVPVAVLVGVAPLVWRPRYYASGASFVLSCVLLALAALVAALSVLLPRVVVGAGLGRWSGSSVAFATALCLSTAAGVAMVVATPAPRIDVFVLLQGSTRGLVHGADMYRQQWAPPGSPSLHGGLSDVYPYLPGTSVLLLPFRLLLGDVRYGLLAALGLAAVLVRRTADPRTPALLPLLVAVYPKVTYADQQSWTEPLLVCALAGTVWAVRAGHGRVAMACLAAALASKQHVALLLPLAAWWRPFGVRRTLAASGLAALAVAPWVVAGPRDFWHDAVATNLDYPVLDHSLSLPALAHHWGWSVGFGLTAVGLVGAYALAWWVRGDTFGFCAGGALVLLVLDLTNKQSFFNHYTLVMGLLVLAVATADRTAPGDEAAPAARLSGSSRTAPATIPPAATGAR